ncbi:hypothetical protein ACLKA6_010045 [Drosophila palustris]
MMMMMTRCEDNDEGGIVGSATVVHIGYREAKCLRAESVDLGLHESVERRQRAQSVMNHLPGEEASAKGKGAGIRHSKW